MKDNREATMQGLMITFREDNSTIEMLMSHLIQKGVVETEDQCITSCGSKCGSCHLSTVRIYRWVSN